MNSLKNDITINNASLVTVDKHTNQSYEDAVLLLTSQGKFHISLGLERISKVLDLLGNPQDALKIIHVAGTNGKGSTCAMLASVLTEAGYKTGLYSSPHLVEYTERIKINKTEISKNDFAGLIFSIVETADKAGIHITEFEILTAAAFLYFKENGVEYVLLETGLGGRLDATNVVKKPVLTIITSIDFDHVDRLGSTIEQIAFEKAGIIKTNVPVVTLKNNKGMDVIKTVSKSKSSELVIADSTGYCFEDNIINTGTEKYELSLSGLWQLLNLSLALESVKCLNKAGVYISGQSLKAGLKNVSWPARFQYIKKRNLIIDGAHNESGAYLLRKSLDLYFPEEKRIWIYSSLNTKDYAAVINNLFRHGDTVICTKSISNNAVLPSELSKKIMEIYPDIHVCNTDCVKQAYDISLSSSSNSTITIIAGSLYTIGELLAYFPTLNEV